MSKELIEVKKDSFKSIIKDIILMFIIICVGVSIIFLSFYISYTKMNADKLSTKSAERIEVVPENSKEEIVFKEDDKSFDNESIELEIANTNNQLPQWTDTAISDIKSIYSSEEKQVYLTFDDGPSPEVTPEILQILKEEEVPATFFVLGKCVDKYPELVKQEYEEGHFIANHGYTHTYSQIYSSVDSVYNEYIKTNDAIKNALQNQEYDSHLFRFPGGSSGGPYDSLKSEAKQFLAENQIASTNWNCLTSDAAGNTTVQEQYDGVLETQGDKNSLIILMHDSADKTVTPQTLKLIIKYYKSNGYEFKNFYEIFSEENEINVNNEE